MRTPGVCGIRLTLLLAVLILFAFMCAAVPAKPIPRDEINPKLETVLQELARTAHWRPKALPEIAKGYGIPCRWMW